MSNAFTFTVSVFCVSVAMCYRSLCGVIFTTRTNVLYVLIAIIFQYKLLLTVSLQQCTCHIADINAFHIVTTQFLQL